MVAKPFDGTRQWKKRVLYPYHSICRAAIHNDVTPMLHHWIYWLAARRLQRHEGWHWQTSWHELEKYCGVSFVQRCVCWYLPTRRLDAIISIEATTNITCTLLFIIIQNLYECILLAHLKYFVNVGLQSKLITASYLPLSNSVCPCW